MAYYVLMFDNAADRFSDLIDRGTNYVDRSRHSYFVPETHVKYRRELYLEDPLQFTLRLIDVDEKCINYYLEVLHAEQGFCDSTSKQIAMRVDLAERKSKPFPKDMKKNFSRPQGTRRPSKT